MRPTRKILLTIGLSVLVIAPLSVMLTLLLLPLWRWLEANAGVESVGHSGPAGWCYLAVFFLLAMIGALGIRREEKRELNAIDHSASQNSGGDGNGN